MQDALAAGAKKMARLGVVTVAFGLACLVGVIMGIVWDLDLALIAVPALALFIPAMVAALLVDKMRHDNQLYAYQVGRGVPGGRGPRDRLPLQPARRRALGCKAGRADRLGHRHRHVLRAAAASPCWSMPTASPSSHRSTGLIPLRWASCSTGSNGKEANMVGGVLLRLAPDYGEGRGKRPIAAPCYPVRP